MEIKKPDADHIRRVVQMKSATAYLAALACNVKLLWACACRWEGWEVDTESPARTFSVDNPFVTRLNARYALLWKHRGEHDQGGLCAIEIQPMEDAEV